jgi:hypothetical protein
LFVLGSFGYHPQQGALPGLDELLITPGSGVVVFPKGKEKSTRVGERSATSERNRAPALS